MKLFMNMRMRSKIILLVGFLVAAMVLIGVLSLIKLNIIGTEMDFITYNSMPKIEYTEELGKYASNLRRRVLQHVISDTPEEHNLYETRLKGDIDSFIGILENLKPLLKTDEGKKAYSVLEKNWDEFTGMVKEAISLSKQGWKEQALILAREKSKAVEDKLDESLSVFEGLVKDDTDNAMFRAGTAHTSAKNTTLIILAISAVFGIVLGLFTAKAISDPIQKLVVVAEKAAQGDLREEISAQSADEIGILTKSFGDMIKSLRNVIGEAAKSAAAVASTSEELAAAAEESASAVHQVSSTIGEISAGIEEQTASTNQTAASVHQSNQAIAQVAEGAEAQVKSIHQALAMLDNMKKALDKANEGLEKVSVASKESAKSAHRGGKATEDLIAGMAELDKAGNASGEAMEKLDAHTQDIGKILEVIDDIAEQTNLLALNAAIEAARAGEHGRGFAVVADEVRKLAERSSVETKAIAELITGVTQASKEVVEAVDIANKHVRIGNKLSLGAKIVLEEIIANTENIDVLIEGLEKSVQELVKAGGSARKSIGDVVGVSEENTAAAEEMAAQVSEVEKAMDNIASVSEESAASIAEISASTEQISASIEQIAASSQELANMAGKLTQAVNIFRIN